MLSDILMENESSSPLEQADAGCVWGRKCWSRWVPAVCGAIPGQRLGGCSIHPSPFLAVPAGPHCHVSWENIQPLRLPIDQLLRRCVRFAELHVITWSLSPRQLKPVLNLVFNLYASAPSGKIMFHFSALVCPGLANSLGKGPLLVVLISNNGSKETGVTMARGAAIASLAAAGIFCQGGATPPGTFRNAGRAGLSGWWVPRGLSPTSGGRCWPLPAPSCSSQGGSREIQLQQRWVAALPSAEEFEKVWHAGSVARVQGAGSIRDSHPFWVMKGKEDSSGRWCLQSSLQGLACAQLQLQNSVGVCAPQMLYSWSICIYRNFAGTTTEMWFCAKLWNTVNGTNHWLAHGHGGERRWKMIQFLVLWAFWWLLWKTVSAPRYTGQTWQGYSLHVLETWVVQGLTESLWLSGKWNWNFSSAWDKLPPPSLCNQLISGPVCLSAWVAAQH